MDEFQNKFIEEATDLINDLEDALLEIENNPEDKQLVERIFRVMHSLKGSGAMFGFESISEFTHNLENIYDLIRNGKLSINREILNVTLASVDHIKLLLESDDLRPEVSKEHKALLNKILKIIESEDGGAVEKTENNQGDLAAEKTYFIHFMPNADIFRDGTNPLYLLDELCTFGDFEIFPNSRNIPPLEEFDINSSYFSWDIFIATPKEVQALHDVFIFVEGECALDVEEISNQNILKDNHFKEWLSKQYDKEMGFDLDELKQFVDTHFAIEMVSSPSLTSLSSKKSETKDNVISSIRVSSDKLDQLMNLVSELVTTQASLTLFAENSKLHDLVVISENVENLTRQLRDIAFSISLVPIESMLVRYHRLVRDMSVEYSKDIIFETNGAETELDKTLIQNLNEPLMHIIRNSVDHGIESKEERIQKGKDAQGKIIINAYYSGANVVIKITDDGRGINPKMIREKAISKGLIHPDTNYSDKEYLNMIFLPGLSTAQIITEVSGRGVGMDVVKKKINEVRGEVEIESVVDQGTVTTIKLPLTLSIIDGLLVRINKTHYVIPLSVVDKIYEAEHEKLVNSYNNIIVLDGEQVPFYYLREEFGDVENIPEQEQIIAVKYEDTRVGLAVDYVVGEYQAVLKPLGKHYRNHEIISGATILGDGTIALVFDTNKIIKQFSDSEIITSAENE